MEIQFTEPAHGLFLVKGQPALQPEDIKLNTQIKIFVLQKTDTVLFAIVMDKPGKEI